MFENKGFLTNVALLTHSTLFFAPSGLVVVLTCERGFWQISGDGYLQWYKFILILFPLHYSLWLRHPPGVGQHNSIQSPIGLSGSGCDIKYVLFWFSSVRYFPPLGIATRKRVGVV